MRVCVCVKPSPSRRPPLVLALYSSVANNAAQGILSSFFFKFADTILKKYSSTVATIFTGLMSAVLFGHALSINFCIGVTIVLISMHLFFTSAPSAVGRRNPLRGEGEGVGEWGEENN